MLLPIYLLSAGLILCLIFSNFFSASEMALSSANHIRLENEAESGNKKAEIALKLIDHFDDALGAILIGNNLVNIAASSIATVLVVLLLGEKWSWISTVVVTILVIIFGETIPKIIARQNATSEALSRAFVLNILVYVFKPIIVVVVGLINLITKNINSDEEADADEDIEELQTIIETAEDEGVLDEDQTELLKAAIDFADISAFEVMTARVDVEAINVEDPIEEILAFVNKTRYSRIPVYEESLDNIIGILHLNVLLKEAAKGPINDIRPLLLKPIYVYKTTKLPDVLDTLRKEQQHMAIVSDEYAGTDGIITMEDVMEEIVGEIWDESDVVEEEVIEKNENQFVIDGDLPISDLCDLLELEEDSIECDSDTVGGLVMELLERWPEVGDEVVYDNLTIKVLEAGDRRVDKVFLTREIKEEEEE